jgi:hypothetical protein
MAKTCFAAECPAEGTHFPVIHFGPIGGDGWGYRLEVPRLVCGAHQLAFQPDVFFTDQAREGMARMLLDDGRRAPDYSVLSVEWWSARNPMLLELGNGGAARLWWG